MGRYIDWEDIVDRYPVLETLGGADELSSSYIVYAETYVEGALSAEFTPPFSSNNLTIKDLCIDRTYWLAGRHKLEDASAVRSDTMVSIEHLKKGEMLMIDTNGAQILSNEGAQGIYSSTQSYHSSFGMKPVDEWRIDEDRIDDERDRD